MNASKQQENVNITSTWGKLKLNKLPGEINVGKLKQARNVLADEPLLPSILTYDSTTPENEFKIKKDTFTDKKTKTMPLIDSYIVNTIKLNQIVKNRVMFDQVELFKKWNKAKNKSGEEKNDSLSSSTIKTNEELRSHLRQFITIMCLHIDFTEISSIAMDTLVDVLDHFLESFFKLLKNLRAVHVCDINSKYPPTSNNYYFSQNYVEQALKEFGLGSVRSLKEFYVNDVVGYYRETYRKVNALYKEYKEKKLAQKLQASSRNKEIGTNLVDGKIEHDIEADEFMKDSDILNDESNSIIGEFLTDFDSSHFDEEINKLFQFIGNDTLSILPEDLPDNIDRETQNN